MNAESPRFRDRNLGLLAFEGEENAPSLRDSGGFLGYAHPVLKHGANNHCAYGADFWLDKSNAIPLALRAVRPL